MTEEHAMARRTKPPFRADHVGSLLRPKSLLDAREAAKAGRLSAAELRHAEDEAIKDVVRMEEEIGLQGVTDGEFRRGSWHMDFLYQVGGVTKMQDNLKVRFHNEKGDIEFTPAASTPTRSPRSASSAAAISSSTTPASPISTTRRSASTSPSSAAPARASI